MKLSFATLLCCLFVWQVSCSSHPKVEELLTVEPASRDKSTPHQVDVYGVGTLSLLLPSHYTSSLSKGADFTTTNFYNGKDSKSSSSRLMIYQGMHPNQMEVKGSELATSTILGKSVEWAILCDDKHNFADALVPFETKYGITFLHIIINADSKSELLALIQDLSRTKLATKDQ